eukprot:4664853-Prymnesium_polylepis.1
MCIRDRLPTVPHCHARAPRVHVATSDTHRHAHTWPEAPCMCVEQQRGSKAHDLRSARIRSDLRAPPLAYSRGGRLA